jgi:hypothetical protein
MASDYWTPRPPAQASLAKSRNYEVPELVPWVIVLVAFYVGRSGGNEPNRPTAHRTIFDVLLFVGAAGIYPNVDPFTAEGAVDLGHRGTVQ